MARQVQDVIIANGASLSGIIDCGSEYTLVGLDIPTITSASLTFQVASHTGTTTAVASGTNPQDALEAKLTFRDLKDAAGTEYTVVATTGNIFVTIPDYLLEGAQFIKIRSGTSAAPVTQGAARTIRCVLAE